MDRTVEPAHGQQSVPEGRTKPVLRNEAYREFMDFLFSGQLKPGLLVSQRELCEFTGSTIGAMREALKRLEAEGVIRLIPRRGVMVREPTEREFNDVYGFRQIVEPIAARRYADTGDLARIDGIRMQTLEIVARKAETRAQIGQLSRARSLVDDLMHEVVLAHLGNGVIDEAFERMRVVVRIGRLSLPPRFMDSLPGLREHLEIIAAIVARDGAAAERLMVDHLENGRRRSVGLE